MEFDARVAANGTTLEADLCVVGAGPVGLSLASALAGSGLRVVIVESGDDRREPETEELAAGDWTGDFGRDLQSLRSRGVGGTAALWNTGVAGAIGAKYVPLDAIDFESKSWAPWSGWAFGRDELDRYYAWAHVVCGLGAFDYAATTWSDDRHPLLELGSHGLTSGVFQNGHASVFRETLPRTLRDSDAVTLVVGATVTEIVRNPRDRSIVRVRWSTLSGGHGEVKASRFVLTAGGIENARLLLLLERADGSHAPRNDWLGRGFMDHPIDRSIALVSRAAALAGNEPFYLPHAVGRPPTVMGRIALSPDLMRDMRLPNASVRMLEAGAPRVLQSASPRRAARMLVPLPAARRVIGNTIRRVVAIGNRFRGATYPLLIDIEQLPHRDNRVILADKVDRFGRPRAELQWRWRAEDEAHRVRIRAAVVEALQRSGVGRAIVQPARPVDPDAHHHTGTTRMHPDSREGVVDASLRVHGEENLYVVGSSVFPTAGFANPTLTAIALALRLADHLAGKRVSS